MYFLLILFILIAPINILNMNENHSTDVKNACL